MPILKPVAPPNEGSLDLSREMAVLRAAGLDDSQEKVEKRFQNRLDAYGLGIDAVLTTLASVANSDNDGIKLSAVRTTLQLMQHPAFVPKSAEAQVAPVINFVVNSQNFNMQNVLTPQGGRKIIDIAKETDKE